MIAFKIISPFFYMAMRIVSVIVYLLTILSAFGGHVNPDYLTFPSMLTLALPYFTILTIILIIFWAVCRKIFFCGLGVLTIFLCLSPLSDAFPISSSNRPEGGARTFKIISWNVIHTWDLRKPDYPGNRAVDFMINSDADIICLAELREYNKTELKHFPKSLKDSLFKAYPYRAGLNSTDLKVLSKYPVERMEKASYNHLGNCRYDFFKVHFPENELIVAMVHLYSYGLSPTERRVVTEINSMRGVKTSMEEFKGSILQKMRKAFRHRAEDAELLRESLDEIPDDVPLIVCGDFNDVPASWAYNVIRGEDLQDAYSETNFGPAITYNMHAFYFHIDQMLYRGPLKALDITVDKINTSDHYPLVGEFQFK